MPTRLLTLASAFLILAISAAPAAASSGLVGDWKLDEGSATSIADSSGDGNNGVLSGDASWVSGISGSALSFDGGNGQVTVPDSVSLEPADALTVAAWVKAGPGAGRFRYIVAKGTAGCIAASYGLYSGPHGGLQFYVSRGQGTTYERSPDAGTGVWDNQWHLVVGTFDGSVVRLYVDGGEVGSGTSYPGALVYTLPDSNDLYIGNYPGCKTPRGFRGVIDDVMIWNRALNQSEIQALEPAPSASGQPAPPPTQTPSPIGTGPSGQPGGDTPGAGNGPPEIQGLKLSSTSLTIGPGGRLVRDKGHAGPTITYTETEAARLTITLLRSESGLRRGGPCVKAVAHDRRRGSRCSLYVVIYSFMHNDPPGRSTIRLGWLSDHRLLPGRYRLDVTPRALGTTGQTVSLSFVVRRARHTRG